MCESRQGDTEELPDCAYQDDALTVFWIYVPPAAAPSMPELRLWIAVLLQAAKDALRGDVSAHIWFKTKHSEPFSARWICDMLGLDPITLYETARQHPIGLLNHAYAGHWAKYWRSQRAKVQLKNERTNTAAAASTRPEDETTGPAERLERKPQR